MLTTNRFINFLGMEKKVRNFITPRGAVASAVFVVALSGATIAAAATTTCGTLVEKTFQKNLGCEFSNSASQDFLNTNPITVNDQGFFGSVDWSFLGKNNVGGDLEGGSAPTLTGSDIAQGGTMGISGALWSTHSQIMAIFKSGNKTSLTGFLLNTNQTMFTYTSPFLGNGDPKDVSHVSLYGRGTPDGNTGGPLSPVPLPAGLPLLLSALGVAAFLRKRRS